MHQANERSAAAYCSKRSSIAINNVVLLRYNHKISITFKNILRRNKANMQSELDHRMKYNFSTINVKKFVVK